MADTTVRVLSEGAPQRCPYCHQTLTGQGPVEDCGHCAARMHVACLRELRRCASCDTALGPQVEAGPWDQDLPAPPAGRFRLRHRPGELEVEWDHTTGREWALVAVGSVLLCPLLPALPLVLPVLWERRRGRLALGPRELVALAEGGTLGMPREARISRKTFRGVRLNPGSRRLELQGASPVRLLVSGLFSGLTAEELRWLAEVLRRWRPS